jgi:hypothetical protein
MLARHIRISWVLAATFAALVPPAALSETLSIDGQVAVKPTGVETPQRGLSMAVVEQKFGAPANKSGPVGSSAKNPPITKWFYPNFVVVFENDKVIHTVVVGG